jgi:molybdopterin/thiamine biosynthesis adenylyltransferase
MTRYRIKVAEADFDELKRLVFAASPAESAAFALAGVATRRDETDVLVRRAIEVPEAAYRVRNEYHLDISPRAINGIAALCEANRLGVVLCHSHPKGPAEYSPSDDHGERRIAATLRSFIPETGPVASLLFHPNGIRGRLWLPGVRDSQPLREILVVGRRTQSILLDGPASPRTYDSALFDRQIRAFGKQGQAVVAATKVAIVGTGGTGSPTAEQVIRLGVQDLLLIDPDLLSPSTRTRVYGSFARRRLVDRLFPRRKVFAVARHLRRIMPNAAVRSIPQYVVQEQAAGALLDRDVVFLCTDDHWGRSVVNQIAHQYLIPTINLGVRIGTKDGTVTGAVGTVDVLRPGAPCLWCTQFLSPDRIAAESMPRSQRRRLTREGYVEELDEPAPAVVSLTTTTSGLAVGLFLQLATGFMGDNGDVARLNYDALSGTVRRGRTQIADKCVCRRAKGRGDLAPLPTLDDLRFLEA